MDTTHDVLPDNDEERTTFWLRHVEAWQQSGLSQSAYAAEQHLPFSRFNYWKRKLNIRAPGSFVQVNLEPGASVRIYHRSGTVVECLSGTDTHWLRSLLGMDHAT